MSDRKYYWRHCYIFSEVIGAFCIKLFLGMGMIMKFLLMILTLNIALFASQLDTYAKTMGFERDYTQAMVEAKKSHKAVMLLMTREDCPWCRKFERVVLNDDTVKQRLAQEVVVVIVDKNLDKTHFPSKKYKSFFSPKGFFISPFNEKVLLEMNGYVKKEDFINELDKVKSKMNK